MESHHKLILLEGISGSGKTTMKHRLNELRAFQDYHICRLTATEWVYATLNRRYVDLEKLRQDEDKIQDIWDTTLVTLTCDPYLALGRKRAMVNELIEPDIAIANKLFLVYHNYLTTIKKKIIINTTDKCIDGCAELVLKRVLV